MKRNIFALAGAGLAVASLAIFTSCEENKLEETPTVTLEKVSEDLNSVSFSVSATNASEVAYVQQDDLTSVPSAKGIITAGVKVSASEPQTVTISDCTPGMRCSCSTEPRSDNRLRNRYRSCYTRQGFPL